jgi:hypothetical protein
MTRKPGVLLFGAMLLIPAAHSTAQVKVTVDRNTGTKATPAFKFDRVPSPMKDDAAAHARAIRVYAGHADGNSGGIKALNDGVLPLSADDPSANFFFDAGSDGGRIWIDLGDTIDIAAVNTYSWHPDTRGPQVYNLFVSDGSASNFRRWPDENTDPAEVGWKLIASVDTRPQQGEGGGQYGVNVTDASGSIGKYRYVLIDTIPTENDDPFGNTFFSEIDVVARQ